MSERVQTSSLIDIVDEAEEALEHVDGEIDQVVREMWVRETNSRKHKEVLSNNTELILISLGALPENERELLEGKELDTIVKGFLLGYKTEEAEKKGKDLSGEDKQDCIDYAKESVSRMREIVIRATKNDELTDQNIIASIDLVSLMLLTGEELYNQEEEQEEDRDDLPDWLTEDDKEDEPEELEELEEEDELPDWLTEERELEPEEPEEPEKPEKRAEEKDEFVMF